MGTAQGEQIVIPHLLALVRILEEYIVIEVVQLLFAHPDSKTLEPVFQGGVAAAGCEHYLIVVDSHVLGVDDFVCGHILQDPVLVYA